MQTLQSSSKEAAIPETQTSEAQSSDTTVESAPIPTKWDNLSVKELRERTAEAAEKQKKRKMIEYLRDLDAGKNPTLDSSVLQEGSVKEGDRKRPRNNIWGNIQLSTPSFKGKSWTELQVYFTQLSTQFDIEPDQFEKDAQKIQYASSCLEGDMKRRWTWYWSEECNRSYDNLTYDNYVRWCEYNISDANTRTLDATSKLDHMQQRENEKFANFMLRSEAALSEIPVHLPDIFRIAWVIQKCLPEIKNNIISQGFPASWQQLRSHGVNAEAMLEQVANKNGNKNDGLNINKGYQRYRSSGWRHPEQKDKDSDQPELNSDVPSSPQEKRREPPI